MKRKWTAAVLAVLLVLCAGFTVACGRKSETKTEPTLDKTEFLFSTELPADIVVPITFNDAVFEKLMQVAATVDAENYTVAADGITIKQDYLASFSDGTYAFTVVTDIKNLDFNITITSETDEITIEELLNDPYYRVELGSGNGLPDLPDADSVDSDSAYGRYLRMVEANKALEVGESFTVEFGTDAYWDMRLRPYTNWFDPPAAKSSTTFEYVEEGDDTGLHVTSNGLAYGVTDKLEFRGSQFVTKVPYELQVTYKLGSVADAKYYMAFNGSIIMSLSGEGKQTAGATFSIINEPYGLGADIMHNLELLISCAQPADITIYSITLRRLAPIEQTWEPLSEEGDKFTENFTDGQIGYTAFDGNSGGATVTTIKDPDDLSNDVLSIDMAATENASTCLMFFDLGGDDASSSLMQPGNIYKISYRYKTFGEKKDNFYPTVRAGTQNFHQAMSVVSDGAWHDFEYIIYELTNDYSGLQTNFGFYFVNNTQMYIDDISIENVGSLPTGDSSWQPLREAGDSFVENFTDLKLGAPQHGTAQIVNTGDEHGDVLVFENAIAGVKDNEIFYGTSGSAADGSDALLGSGLTYKVSFEYKGASEGIKLHFGYVPDGKNSVLEPVTTTPSDEWQTAEITFKVEEDSVKRHIQFYLGGGGSIMIDNLRIEIPSEEGEPDASWEPLRDIGDVFEENFTDKKLGDPVNKVAEIKSVGDGHGNALVFEDAAGGATEMFFGTSGSADDGSDALLGSELTYKVSFEYKGASEGIDLRFGYVPNGRDAVLASVATTASDEWQTAEITFKVEEDSVKRHIIFYLGGGGSITIDNLRIECIEG